jgi:hypothetical protein
LKEQTKKFAEKLKLEHVPLTVASDHETGPSDYKIGAEDELTVIVAKEGSVVARYAGPASKLDIENVLNEVKTMLQ